MGGVEAQTFRQVPPAVDNLGHYGGRNCTGYAICRLYDQPYNASSPINEQYSCGDMSADIPTGFLETVASGNTKAGFFSSIYTGAMVKFNVLQHAVYIEAAGSDSSNTTISEVTDYNGTFNINVSLESMISRTNSQETWYTGWTIWKTKKKWPVIARTNINPGPGDPLDNVRIFTYSGGTQTGPSPQTSPLLSWKSYFSVTEMMDNDLYDGMRLIFTGWKEKGDGHFYEVKHSSHSWNSKVYHYATDFYLEAQYSKNYEITVENSMVNLGNTGEMEIDDVVYNLPLSSPYLNRSTYNLKLRAVDNTINGIIYKFDHWSYNGSSSREITFIPTSAMTVTDYFTGTPQKVTGIYSNTPIGAYIHLYWTAHPNSTCQYKIWRKVKPKNGTETTEFMATLSHSVTNWTDPDYMRTSGYSEDLLSYDIRAYFPTEGSSAETNYTTFVYGESGEGGGGGPFIPNIADMSPLELFNENKSDTKNEIKAFPNPFNPSTTIAYRLSRDGNLDLSIYDMSGRLVKILYRGFALSGSYSVVWNGVNVEGRSVGSGIYLLRMNDGREQFVKRLIMLK